MSELPAAGLISAVRPGSPAAVAGVGPGDRLIRIAGKVPRDAVDVWFYEAEDEVEAVFLKADNGLEDAVVFEKTTDEDLGLEFAEATWDGVELCNNNCFFCFLKGLPRGLRRPLYLKDDDYRLSFLHGNFVTLTNLTDADWERLEEQRLSPLNVSVHATDTALRRRMLGNQGAPDVLEQIRRLAAMDIRVHTQIVVTRGVNDGDQLDRSLRELIALYPTVQTVSVVPVGASPRLEMSSLDRHGIELERPDRRTAREIVAAVRRHQTAARERFAAAVAFCADEYYLTAGARLPSGRSYGDFPQFENGVGMVRSLIDGWRRERRRIQHCLPSFEVRRVVLATGTLIAPTLETLATELAALTGLDVVVTPVENELFGTRVNVAGLIPGADFARALAGEAADLVVLPRNSLDYFGRHFLDGMTPSDLERRIDKRIAFALTASDLIGALEGDATGPERGESSNGVMWSPAGSDGAASPGAP